MANETTNGTTKTRNVAPRAKHSAPPPSPRSFSGFSEITSFLWSVADLLRGDYKQADYGKVILPLTVLRRLDCVLDKTKEKGSSPSTRRSGSRSCPRAPSTRCCCAPAARSSTTRASSTS